LSLVNTGQADPCIAFPSSVGIAWPTDGIWVMNIHRKHRSRDQQLKPKVSTRKFALRGALLDEGFLVIVDQYRWVGRYSATCGSTPTSSEPAR
jgi:hypothetical protein